MCKWVWSTHTRHLQREPRQSLRRSMRNKYLIAGWPTSCALKSYLSVSASIMAAASYLRPCSADAARDNFKKEPEETKEPTRPLIQSLLALASLAPGCLARRPTCDLHELLSWSLMAKRRLIHNFIQLSQTFTVLPDEGANSPQGSFLVPCCYQKSQGSEVKYRKVCPTAQKWRAVSHQRRRRDSFYFHNKIY